MGPQHLAFSRTPAMIRIARRMSFTTCSPGIVYEVKGLDLIAVT